MALVPLLVTKNFLFCCHTDIDTMAELQSFQRPLKTFREQVIGKSNVQLEGKLTCRKRECSLGELLCDRNVLFYRNTRTAIHVDITFSKCNIKCKEYAAFLVS